MIAFIRRSQGDGKNEHEVQQNIYISSYQLSAEWIFMIFAAIKICATPRTNERSKLAGNKV